MEIGWGLAAWKLGCQTPPKEARPGIEGAGMGKPADTEPDALRWVLPPASGLVNLEGS
ncbi:hypothetical protein NEUTE1DRAFT_115672 [Neurospora tetrasperma FGSC 2508]|uniref:Uncharacterized protein n=1 Tax=Neurospora tetrasperma (strain FGSC 2508 / ATCC MYA-4615 / P0657) TaxID=510951 RepID=F8MBH9_NEUT8|nr:uncharacterized protein NEUTE1DRAFT_115672 [Neurospora tetrasperma FGSC 2508]EGO60291.1 hypothetical protein NEUTE1DRAFT_115672 [Neurospora tetrasperma FGSC 2508]EGZ75745.1 hypothetical protein NEUTE2DRAFT_143810 [Neurospora tetrasperma FGSC 2509]